MLLGQTNLRIPVKHDWFAGLDRDNVDLLNDVLRDIYGYDVHPAFRRVVSTLVSWNEVREQWRPRLLRRLQRGASRSLEGPFLLSARALFPIDVVLFIR